MSLWKSDIPIFKVKQLLKLFEQLAKKQSIQDGLSKRLKQVELLIYIGSKMRSYLFL